MRQFHNFAQGAFLHQLHIHILPTVYLLKNVDRGRKKVNKIRTNLFMQKAISCQIYYNLVMLT